MERDRTGGRMLWVRVVGAACALALALLARPPEAVARTACSPYISGGPSNPASGSLIGTMTVEECAIISGGLAGTGAEYQRCQTFEVGYYNMGSSTLKLDCRDYTEY